MFLIIYLFLMVFPPRIGPFGDVVSILSLFLVTLAFFITPIEPFQVRRIRGIVVAIFSGLFGYSMLLFLVNTPHELFYMMRFGRVLLQFVGCYSLVRIYYAKYGMEFGKTIICHLFWAIAFHSIIMLGMYFNSSLRFLIASFVVPSTNQDTKCYNRYKNHKEKTLKFTCLYY